MILRIRGALIKPQLIISKQKGSPTDLRPKNILKMQYTKNTLNSIIATTSDRNINFLSFLVFVVNSFSLILFSVCSKIGSTI